MTKIPTLLGVSAILAFTAASALAAPCNTGSTQGRQAANDKSSNADSSTKNLAGGQQAGAPKTVGAMNNTAADRPTSPADVTRQAEGKPTAAQQGQGAQAGQGQGASSTSSGADHSTKNLAGGQQPSSPKTVGAMNNVGANQIPGQRAQKDDGC